MTGFCFAGLYLVIESWLSAHPRDFTQPYFAQTLAAGERRNILRMMFSGERMHAAIGYKGARVAKLDRGMVDDLFDMRLLLEPLALKSALPHLTKLDLARAEMALDAAEAGQEPSRLSELNWDFHHALYYPSNRQTLLRTIEQLNKASALAEVIASSIVARPEKSAAEHLKLLQACRDGDEAGAIARLGEHLRLAHHDIRNQKE